MYVIPALTRALSISLRLAQQSNKRAYRPQFPTPRLQISIANLLQPNSLENVGRLLQGKRLICDFNLRSKLNSMYISQIFVIESISFCFFW